MLISTETSIPITKLVKRLWINLSTRRRVQFILLLQLMVLVTFAEIFSIGAVIPFLGVLTVPERVFNISEMQPIINFLGLTESKELIFPITTIFCVAALSSGAMRLIYLWTSIRLSFATGADLSSSIYFRTLYQPYTVHCSRNSSDLITGISTKANIVIYSTIVPLLTLISSIILLIAILYTLLRIDSLIAIASFGLFGLFYFFIVSFTHKKLLSDSHIVAFQSSRAIKLLQEGMGGIRDILIDGTQSVYCQLYQNADSKMRLAQGNGLFIAQAPRYVMEALGMTIIAILAYSLAKQPESFLAIIPTLGALALGAQRLIPIAQQAYSAWTQIKSSQASLQETLELLEQKLPEYLNNENSEKLLFQKTIKFNKVDFQYNSNSSFTLKNIDLSISKGSRVGIIGETGSGKSTLLDILMGLLQPTNGSIEVDGQKITFSNQRAWQARIAHVPQSIFLTDSTVKENIAFGLAQKEIDQKLLTLATEKAQISKTIEEWPDGYQTLVGERGIRLSGGQVQRIGIARALYKQAEVIIFDESTSALDSETEKAIMEGIDSLNKNITIFIIAHRLTSLRNCSHIVKLSDGKIKQIGSYQDMVAASN